MPLNSVYENGGFLGTTQVYASGSFPKTYYDGIWNLQAVYDTTSASLVTDGLVLNLDAANPASYPGSGTTWTDLSGLDHNGTLTNGPTYSASPSGSIVLDGVNDYVTISETAAMRPSVLTLEIVFEITSDTNTVNGAGATNQYIAFRQNTRTTVFEGYHLKYEEDTDRVTIATSTSAGAASVLNSPTSSVPLNSIKHIICLFDTTTMSIYINGSISAGPAAKGTGIDYNLTHTLKLGRTVPVGSSFDASMNGKIYECRIYNRILSETEITNNYNVIKGKYAI